ncbi:MAG: phosphonate ABC transporter, permease protein PhnE [Pikeienuella sp.]|uniref:phosphonate ABC transporter, permease protein PhnE n=1 Tax=Pikeienuella sp. TaxID=2831957 RepID=UPI00391CE705
MTGRAGALASWWPGLLVAALVLWSAATLEADLSRVAAAGPRLGAFIARMAPPDLSVWPEVLDGLLETLRIAVVGTLGAILLSAILGPAAAATVSPGWIVRPARVLLALLRAVPLIIVAMLMVSAVGLGPLPGILAVLIHGTGMLAKYYAEAIDDVDPAASAALESAGAGLLQRLRFAVWPQMAPAALRDTIFRFELNLRESLILGVVGAGGIGLHIQTYVRSFQFEKAATATLAVVAAVLLIEALNGALRRRVA